MCAVSRHDTSTYFVLIQRTRSRSSRTPDHAMWTRRTTLTVAWVGSVETSPVADRLSRKPRHLAASWLTQLVETSHVEHRCRCRRPLLLDAAALCQSGLRRLPLAGGTATPALDVPPSAGGLDLRDPSRSFDSVRRDFKTFFSLFYYREQRVSIMRYTNLLLTLTLTFDVVSSGRYEGSSTSAVATCGSM